MYNNQMKYLFLFLIIIGSQSNLHSQYTIKGKVISICKGHVEEPLGFIKIHLDGETPINTDGYGNFEFQNISGLYKISISTIDQMPFNSEIKVTENIENALIILEYGFDCDFDNLLKKIRVPKFKNHTIIENNLKVLPFQHDVPVFESSLKSGTSYPVKTIIKDNSDSLAYIAGSFNYPKTPIHSRVDLRRNATIIETTYTDSLGYFYFGQIPVGMYSLTSSYYDSINIELKADSCLFVHLNLQRNRFHSIYSSCSGKNPSQPPIVDFNFRGTLIEKKSKKPLIGKQSEVSIFKGQFATDENGLFECQIGIDCSSRGIYPKSPLIRLTVTGFEPYFFRLRPTWEGDEAGIGFYFQEVDLGVIELVKVK
jgi:hypothetical protein